MTAFTVTAVFASGCSGEEPVPAISGDKLEAGIVYSSDLDGDSAPEEILLDDTGAELTIVDGGLVYRSRERWQVVEACMGDTDQDGLPEIVALLDDEEGRHLGLFAYFGGEYRERLVTSELTPRPLSLEIVRDADDAGDLVRLTVEPGPGQTEVQTVLCRWNGFGFTGIDAAP